MTDVKICECCHKNLAVPGTGGALCAKCGTLIFECLGSDPPGDAAYIYQGDECTTLDVDLLEKHCQDE